MYQIYKDGETMAVVDEPIFIRRHTNGCFVQCPENQAQGIAIQSTPYQLLGRESMGEGLETVMAVEVDGGVYLSGEQATMKEDLAQADETAIDLYETTAAQDEAIIELYEMIGGDSND